MNFNTAQASFKLPAEKIEWQTTREAIEKVSNSKILHI
jgi:hypothetical protein